MKAALIIIASVMLGCAPAMDKATAHLISDDGVRIAYTFLPGAGETGIILLHMLDRNRHDWDTFAQQLQSAGYAVVAIDFRGHGDSQGKWKDFTDKDFNAMVKDVAAAKQFLAQQGAKRIIVIGGSIGANIALNYAATDKDVVGAVLLSPGLDYRGVKTESAMASVRVPVLIVASEEDKYSADSARKLAGMNTEAQLKIYAGAGHGTRMFDTTDLAQVSMDWLKASAQPPSSRRPVPSS
ncbi:alpha/beta fold hydrolase [Candidatus Woesearchaeota archaeon]|nr:alpha/beta fold hydrolase [Candidatus Woesearchaeota archaeon]